MFILHFGQWPLVYFAVEGKPNLEDIHAMHDGFGRMHDRAEQHAQPLVLLQDVRRAKVPPPDLRQELAKLSGAFDGRSERNIAQDVMVVDNKLVMGGLTVIRWLVPRVAKTPVAKTAQDGLAVLVKGAPQVTLPSTVEGFVRDVDAIRHTDESWAKFDDRESSLSAGPRWGR